MRTRSLNLIDDIVRKEHGIQTSVCFCHRDHAVLQHLFLQTEADYAQMNDKSLQI